MLDIGKMAQNALFLSKKAIKEAAQGHTGDWYQNQSNTLGFYSSDAGTSLHPITTPLLRAQGALDLELKALQSPYWNS